MYIKIGIFFGLTLAGFLAPHYSLAAETIDTDSDGLSDYDEAYRYHTNPALADTDADGFPDGEEILNGFTPWSADQKKLAALDSDGDKLFDAIELALGTDLMNPDSDADSYPDGLEVGNGFNPLKGDNDRSLKRSVTVDLTTQQLDYFLNNVKVGTMPVSTGLLSTRTPVGTFKIEKKIPVKRYTGVNYDYPNTKWNLQFKPSYYLHGAYWHDQFGKRPMSHGCVNIETVNAEKIYKFLTIGDSVTISGKTPRVVKASLAKN